MLRTSADSRGMQASAAVTAMGKDGKNSKRITTTFTREQHDALQRIANAHRVDVAWLIRRAVDRFIEQVDGDAGSPLLPFDFR